MGLPALTFTIRQSVAGGESREHGWKKLQGLPAAHLSSLDGVDEKGRQLRQAGPVERVSLRETFRFRQAVAQSRCSDRGAAVAARSEVQRSSAVFYLQHQEPDDVSCNLSLKIPRLTQRNTVLVHQKSARGAFAGVARGTCARGHFLLLGRRLWHNVELLKRLAQYSKGA